jgi:hypothetical protein
MRSLKKLAKTKKKFSSISETLILTRISSVGLCAMSKEERLLRLITKNFS